MKETLLLKVALVLLTVFVSSPTLAGSQKKVYWGDTHLHTSSHRMPF